MAMNIPIPRQEILREFQPIGRYRVRWLRDSNHPDREPMLDIREFVSSDSWEGYTRRGVTLHTRAEVDLLRDILTHVLEIRS